ncbi:unnamed protein product [Arctogadus glacialis]
MLACLPASGDASIHLLSRTQMNTGLQKWETTKKMRSSNYPTPAQWTPWLENRQKPAHNPDLPKQRQSTSEEAHPAHGQRSGHVLVQPALSPYPSQVSGRAGLLAVLRTPAKVIRDSDGGPLDASGPGRHKQQLMAHPQTLQQQQHNLAHPMNLQRPKPCPTLRSAQQQRGPAPTSFTPTAGQTQDLRHAPDGVQLPGLTIPRGQPGPQAAGPGTLTTTLTASSSSPSSSDPNGSPPMRTPRQTSPIYLNHPTVMAGSQHQNRHGDLNSIVNQINQFCQAARAWRHVGCARVRSPTPAISRNLLINASSRVVQSQPGPHVGLPHDGTTGQGPGLCRSDAPQASMAAMSSMAAYHAETEKLTDEHIQQQLKQQQQQQSLQHPQLQLVNSRNNTTTAFKPTPTPASQHTPPNTTNSLTRTHHSNHTTHPLHPHQHPSQAPNKNNNKTAAAAATIDNNCSCSKTTTATTNNINGQHQQLNLQQQRWAQTPDGPLEQPRGGQPLQEPQEEAPSEPVSRPPEPQLPPQAARRPQSSRSSSISGEAPSVGVHPSTGPNRPHALTNGHTCSRRNGITAMGNRPSGAPGPLKATATRGTCPRDATMGKVPPGKADSAVLPQDDAGQEFLGGTSRWPLPRRRPGTVGKGKMPEAAGVPLLSSLGQVQDPGNGRGIHATTRGSPV